MVETLEVKTSEEKNRKFDTEKKVSFAEQFLERPVFAGAYGNLAKVTITCCTYRGIPTIDDF